VRSHADLAAHGSVATRLRYGRFFDYHLYRCLIANVGLAVLELFTVECTGWINCLGVDNDQLTYNYYVAYKNKTSPLPLYSGVNTTVNLIFPVGDANDDYRNKLTVIVSNRVNYTSTFAIYPVQVSKLTRHVSPVFEICKATTGARVLFT